MAQVLEYYGEIKVFAWEKQTTKKTKTLYREDLSNQPL